MISNEFGEGVVTAVSVMRKQGEFGDRPEQLQDGNTIPRLCMAVGEEACKEVCQLSGGVREAAGIKCAENNVTKIVDSYGVELDSFLMVSASEDNVVFGDELEEKGAFVTDEGYAQLPACNALFFRPGVDQLPTGSKVEVMAMRMADCGSVNFRFNDSEGNLVLGQAHFSKPNMAGPTEFMHEIDGRKVSWGEYVAVKAMEHYVANPDEVEIYLAAAVDKEDFVFQFDTLETMRKHFKGWEELGLVEPQQHERAGERFDCLVYYREMIDWQLEQATQAVGFNPSKIDTSQAINTGDIWLGHASHRLGSRGMTAQGRDMYLIGRTQQQ